MLKSDNSRFSIEATVRITLIDRDVPSYFQSLEHLLRYCERLPFGLARLSVTRGPDVCITTVRYVLPKHKAANWVGPGRGRTSTRPGANGVVELTPFEFLDLARLGNPDPVDMKVNCPEGKETFDEETTEEAPSRRGCCQAA